MDEASLFKKKDDDPIGLEKIIKRSLSGVQVAFEEVFGDGSFNALNIDFPNYDEILSGDITDAGVMKGEYLQQIRSDEDIFRAELKKDSPDRKEDDIFRSDILESLLMASQAMIYQIDLDRHDPRAKEFYSLGGDMVERETAINYVAQWLNNTAAVIQKFHEKGVPEEHLQSYLKTINKLGDVAYLILVASDRAIEGSTSIEEYKDKKKKIKNGLKGTVALFDLIHELHGDVEELNIENPGDVTDIELDVYYKTDASFKYKDKGYVFAQIKTDQGAYDVFEEYIRNKVFDGGDPGEAYIRVFSLSELLPPFPKEYDEELKAFRKKIVDLEARTGRSAYKLIFIVLPPDRVSDETLKLSKNVEKGLLKSIKTGLT